MRLRRSDDGKFSYPSGGCGDRLNNSKPRVDPRDGFFARFEVFTSLPKRYPWASASINTTGAEAEDSPINQLQQELSSGTADDEVLIRCANQLVRSESRADLSRFWMALDSAAGRGSLTIYHQFSRKMVRSILMNSPISLIAIRLYLKHQLMIDLCHQRETSPGSAGQTR